MNKEVTDNILKKLSSLSKEELEWEYSELVKVWNEKPRTSLNVENNMRYIGDMIIQEYQLRD